MKPDGDIRSCRQQSEAPSDSRMGVKANNFLRGGSLPPEDFNDKTGLRRSSFPIKVAGITFGSQENLDLETGEAAPFTQPQQRATTNPFWKFGENRNSRRSVTPLRKTPRPQPVEPISAPFGSNKLGQRPSGLGHWGNRVWTKQDSSERTRTESASSSVQNFSRFLSDYDLQDQTILCSSSQNSTLKRGVNRFTTPDDLPRLTPLTAAAASTQQEDTIGQSVDIEETIVIPSRTASRQSNHLPSRPASVALSEGAHDWTSKDSFRNEGLTSSVNHEMEVTNKIQALNQFSFSDRQQEVFTERNVTHASAIVEETKPLFRVPETRPSVDVTSSVEMDSHCATEKQQKVVSVTYQQSLKVEQTASENVNSTSQHAEKITKDQKLLNSVHGQEQAMAIEKIESVKEGTCGDATSLLSRPETSFSDVTVTSSVQMFDPEDVKYHGYNSSRPETRFSDVTISSQVQEVEANDVHYHNGDTEFEFGSDLEGFLEVSPSDVSVHVKPLPVSVQLLMGPRRLSQSEMSKQSHQEAGKIETQETVIEQTEVRQKQESRVTWDATVHEQTVNSSQSSESNSNSKCLKMTEANHSMPQEMILTEQPRDTSEQVTEETRCVTQTTDSHTITDAASQKSAEQRKIETVDACNSHNSVSHIVMTNSSCEESTSQVVITNCTSEAYSQEVTTSTDMVMDKRESEKMEALFDKLVEQEGGQLVKESSMDSIFRPASSSICCDGDVSSADVDDTVRATDSEGNTLEKKPKRTHRRTSERRLSLTDQLDTSSETDRSRAKRRRNRTIDNHDLWCGTVAVVTQKTYTKEDSPQAGYTREEAGCQTASTDHGEVSDGGDAVGQGLGIIIDKLKNIETKLDELKTIESETDAAIAAYSFPDVGVTPTQHTIEDATSEDSLTKNTSTSEEKSMAHYCIEKVFQTEVPEERSDCWSRASDSEDDKTLIVDDDGGLEVESPLVCSPIPSILPTAVSSTNSEAPTPPETPRRSRLDIVSLNSDSNISDEEDEESKSENRAKRIEELAKKMLGEGGETRSRHPSDPGVNSRSLLDIMGELDTVSERSELDEEMGSRVGEADEAVSEDSSTSDSSESTKSFERYCRKKVELEQRRHRGSLRTRSASRERTLAKIKYCWRCHQTGHESYECSAELHPAAWCPRCLESSHWEDACWVTDKEVFCNICTLPGHLPCVHQTNDFRQRKLVIETFGWLAFKDWFREPEFWSWWNCAGFTNVPLYKLMQHRPKVASPDLKDVNDQ